MRTILRGIALSNCGIGIGSRLRGADRDGRILYEYEREERFLAVNLISC